MERINKTELVKRLEKCIKYRCGEEGLNTLLGGWLAYRKYGKKYQEVIRHRKWLYVAEVIDLSDYAQVDLTKMES